jgi:nucleoside 2-deoxyribosyltransferase
MDTEKKTTTPKPFVFVLMPFDEKFDDIYDLGIKGAAEEAGAYVERTDKEIFKEGILDRIFNQINKADVIVADLTGLNPNVFYEVGYAHALGKIVLLLIQASSDIPFDLLHQPHLVYEGKIVKLKTELAKKISWAINEAKNTTKHSRSSEFEVSLNDVRLGSYVSQETPQAWTIVAGDKQWQEIIIRNTSAEALGPLTHFYLFTGNSSRFRVIGDYKGGAQPILGGMKAHSSDAADGFERLHDLTKQLDPLPPGTFAKIKLGLIVEKQPTNAEGEETMRLRFHTVNRSYTYDFKVGFRSEIDQPTE